MDSNFAGRAKDAGASGPTSVLIVDTDLRHVQAVASTLRRAGYRVFEATSFPEGKRLWNLKHPEVLIADVRLGQFNGLQLLLRAYAEQPNLISVVTCAFHDVVLQAETRRFGGTFLVKPVEPSQILEAIGGPIMTNKDVSSTAEPQPSERRVAERRKLLIPNYFADRRLVDRRGTQESVSGGRRQGDRRLLVIPGFTPERRVADRRGSSRSN